MSTINLSHRGPSLSGLRQPPQPQAVSAWLGPGVFILMHVACLGVFVTGANVLALTLCGVVYFLQMVGITAGYHRYFAHRAYKTSRAFQFRVGLAGV